MHLTLYLGTTNINRKFFIYLKPDLRSSQWLQFWQQNEQPMSNSTG